MIQVAWESVFKKRFPGVINLARDASKKAARNGTPPFTGTNYDALKPYNPVWIREEHWIQMVEVNRLSFTQHYMHIVFYLIIVIALIGVMAMDVSNST